MIVVENPEIKFIPIEDREEGISGMLRVKNGEDYLRLCILSVINQLDELIIVFNDSNDNTENIIIELEKDYPDKIKVFKYIPIVYPPNNDKYLETPENSYHSLAYYYNFTLSKTTKTFVTKIDDDQLYFPDTIKKMREKCNDKYCIGNIGINLFDYNNILYVIDKYKFTAGGDIMLFKYNPNCYFIKTDKYEVLKHNYVELKSIIGHYHLKFCKKDRGYDNYNLTEYKSRYYQMFKDRLCMNNNFILLDNIINKLNLEYTPFDLGFYIINNSKKVYKIDEFNNIENNFKIINIIDFDVSDMEKKNKINFKSKRKLLLYKY
jgi:glycosyltransferase involved in cell wall biosynthesis